MPQPEFLIPFNRAIAHTVLPFVEKHNLGIEIHDFREVDVYNNNEKYAFTEDTVAQLLAKIDCLKTLHAPYKELSIFSVDSEIAQVSKDRIIKALHTAQRLHCSKIVVHTGFNPMIADEWVENNTAEKIIAFYSAIASDFPDITICIENSFEDSFLLFEKMFNAQLPANIKMCIDTGHTHLFGIQTTAELIERFAPHISHFHIHDNHGKTDEHLIPGEGTIDWPAVHNALQNVTAPTLLIEVFDSHAVMTQLENVKKLILSQTN